MDGISKTEEQLFEAARKLADPAHRRAFLQAACQDDHALRRRVEQLLEDQPAADEFFADARAEPPAPAAVIGEMTEKPGDRIGRFKLLQKIGEGGMGVVYMAEQEEPVRRRVALKIIKLGMDTKQVVARFEAERQALALMDHPNIAKVFDAAATDTGRPFFIMELVQGVPITEFCDKNRLPAEERIKLFIVVCQAIQSAHQKGIIHRDLKPTNILVTLNAGVPMPMVIDFGVAKATNQKLTEKTVFTNYAAMIGTPAYMSPEQAEMSRLDVDTRSDIYALGVLLYELLTGTTPFCEKRLRNAGYSEMQRIILEEEPERPSTRLSTLAGEQRGIVARNRGASELALGRVFEGDLDCIVMKCLEKDRARRYETANGLAADLKRHLDNEPVVARPPSRAYRLQKAWRRNKLAFTAAAAVAAALVVGTTVSTWQAIEAGMARNAEKQQRLAAQTERDKAQVAEKAAETAQQAEKQARLRADSEKAEAAHLLYVADMNLAQQAWNQNNMGRLRQLLEDTQDSPYRGFEWYYWQPKTHLALKTLRGHLDAVTSVAFSTNGQRIVTGSDDQTAKVWDAASCRELLALKGHRAEISSATFSPDGQRIVTGSLDRTAKVWDAASGKEILTLKGHSDEVWSVAFSPDGQRIVTGSRDWTAKVWEAARPEQVAAWQEEERGAAQYLAALERERSAEQERQRIARARDSIKQWLILSSIPLPTGQSGEQGLDIEQIQGEALLRPKAGEARPIGGVELKWRRVALTNEVIDFNALLGRETTQSVAYAVCYIRAETEQRGLQMLVGSDDEAKVYLNGKQVYQAPFARGFVAEGDTVPDIILNAGLNVLVFKVVNEFNEWKGSIRFTDAQGNPVKGIQVTLDPEAKDLR